MYSGHFKRPQPSTLILLPPTHSILLLQPKQPQTPVPVKHPRSLNRIRLARPQIRSPLLQNPHNLLMSLKNRPSDRTLPAVINRIGIRSFFQQRFHSLRVAVVGGEHEERVAFVVCEVGGDAGGEVLGYLGRGAGAREVEEFGCEVESFWGELGDFGARGALHGVLLLLGGGCLLLLWETHLA